MHSRRTTPGCSNPGDFSGNGPSGLADWPRPFVFRVAHLDGLTIPPGAAFSGRAHLRSRAPVLPQFRAALSRLALRGIGPGRGRAELERTEQLDVAGVAQAVWTKTSAAPIVVSLDPEPYPVESVTVRFLTPTELKSAGGLAERPEFPIIFRRLRDRISTLRSLYGAGALDIDFKGLGERAACVELRRSDLAWEQVKRKSGRTGQVHPIGGFTGEAEYAGHLAEFLPWLRAARWVGVGRQTVWGKGDVRVL